MFVLILRSTSGPVEISPRFGTWGQCRKHMIDSGLVNPGVVIGDTSPPIPLLPARLDRSREHQFTRLLTLPARRG